MQVLKKFGSILLFGLIIGLNSYAHPTHAAKKDASHAKAKQSRTVIAKEKSSKHSDKNLKAKEKTAHKKSTKQETKVIAKVKGRKSKFDTKNLAIQAKPEEKFLVTPTPVAEKCTTIVYVNEKKGSATTDNTDLLTSRTVTKSISPAIVAKKEESSFGSSVMDWVKDKYSCMIDVLPNQISNVMLYHFIDDWYGVKYRMGGTSKKGVDCSAFVQSLYKYVFGMDLLRTACMQFNSSQLIMNPGDLKEGDLVFFKVNSSRISHVGVYLKNNFFVHSASSKGVSIANLSSAYWSKYFAGGGRILQNF